MKNTKSAKKSPSNDAVRIYKHKNPDFPAFDLDSTPGGKDLRLEWYAILKNEGFNDLERDYDPDQPLLDDKFVHKIKAIGETHAETLMESTIQYLDAIKTFVNAQRDLFRAGKRTSTTFEERAILSQLAQARTHPEIVASLKKDYPNLNDRKIERIIAKFRPTIISIATQPAGDEE